MMTSQSLASLHSPRPPLPPCTQGGMPVVGTLVPLNRLPIPNSRICSTVHTKSNGTLSSVGSLQRTKLTASSPSLPAGAPKTNSTTNLLNRNFTTVKQTGAIQSTSKIPKRSYMALTPGGGYVSAPVNIVEKIEINNSNKENTDLNDEILRQHGVKLQDLQEHIDAINNQHSTDRDVFVKLLQDKDAQITMLMEKMNYHREVVQDEGSLKKTCETAPEETHTKKVASIISKENLVLEPINCSCKDGSYKDGSCEDGRDNITLDVAMCKVSSTDTDMSEVCVTQNSGCQTERGYAESKSCAERGAERGRITDRSRGSKIQKQGFKRSSSVANTGRAPKPPRYRHSLQGNDDPKAPDVNYMSKATEILGATPAYSAVDLDDQIDLKIEEEMQKTGIVVPFRRINHGFYTLGDPQILSVGLELKNRKLLAQVPYWNSDRPGSFSNFLKWAKPKVLHQLVNTLESKQKGLQVSRSNPNL